MSDKHCQWSDSGPMITSWTPSMMLLATLSSKYQGICWNCCYFSESKKLHFFPFFRSYSGYLLKLAYVRFSNPSQYLLIMIVMILATSTFNLIETWYILERSLLIMIHDSNNQLFELDRNLEYSRAQFCDVERQDLFSSIHLVLSKSFVTCSRWDFRNAGLIKK